MTQPLDRLRQNLHASEALVWLCDPESARRVLHAGTTAWRTPDAVEIDSGAATIQRLRRAGTILCRYGEVSGLEDLVPSGVRSFVAAATASGEPTTGVLVLGWSDPVPPCDGPSASPLRIAATLLASRLTPSKSPSVHGMLSDTVLESLADRIVVVDRNGLVLAANAAWMESAHNQRADGLGPLVPGSSYFEACRRAAANGAPGAAAFLADIAAVCEGTADIFQTTYADDALGAERWTMMTVTRLARAEGGAVISLADVTGRRLGGLVDRLGTARFRRLADAIPMPLIRMAPDGRVIDANRGWSDIASVDTGATAEPPRWTDPMDPDTSARAAAALDRAVSDKRPFQLDLRLKSADGGFRWWTCVGAPEYKPDGDIESYIAICSEITAARQAQTALSEVTAKLVAAQEVERSRIARELHDDVGQQVALLSAKLETLPSAYKLRRQGLAEARQSLQTIAISLSNLSHRLHPGKIRLLGLAQTLRSLCQEIARESGLQINFIAREIPSDLPEEISVCLYRVAQEALRNAVKHSGATKVDVSLTASALQVRLAITDNGAGLDSLASRSAGIGLLTMHERIELVGGTLVINTGPSPGTSIEATVPIAMGAASV
jgi:signal transduction histidine kinase